MALEKAQEGNINSIVQGIQLLNKYHITSGNVYNEVNYLAGKAHQDKGEYQSATVNYVQCSGYKDADDLYKACSYDHAIIYMEDGNLEKAIVYLTESKGYDNSDELLALCQKYTDFSNKKWVIPKKEMDDSDADRIFQFIVTINKTGKVSIYSGESKCKYSASILKWGDSSIKYELNIKKLKIRKKHFTDNNWIVKSVKRMDADVEYSPYTDEEEKRIAKIDKKLTKAAKKAAKARELPKLPEKPAIGMTEEEARHTQWGDPNNINITETASGVHKQLCFGSGRYAYTFNGSVTSIQY